MIGQKGSACFSGLGEHGFLSGPFHGTLRVTEDRDLPPSLLRVGRITVSMRDGLWLVGSLGPGLYVGPCTVLRQDRGAEK